MAVRGVGHQRPSRSMTLRWTLLAALVLAPLCLAQCPSGWSANSANTKCYKFEDIYTSWNSAEAGCQTYGTYSHLVSIHDNTENVLVYGFCTSRRCHIGLNDIANEGSFVWSDGTPVDYTAWHQHEPNNCCGSEDCGEMWDRGGSTPTWNDMPCDAQFGDFAYVCSQPAKCPPGKYGTNVKTGCTNCPKGKYRASYGATSSSACTACPSGRYGDSTGLTASTCSGACAKGHYCPDGSTSSQQNVCPSGTYGSSTGLGSSACNGVCAAGYYCGNAETSSEPAGKLCAAGRYGSFGQVNSDCTGPCSAGYYCEEGSPSSTQAECGGSARYCPEGSGSYVQVSNGFYTIGGGGTTTRTGQSICEQGYYCAGGIRTPCPAGKYTDTTGNSQCSKSCAAGYYCPTGSQTATQDVCGTGSHPANYYCPAGHPTRVVVDAGHYSTPESNPENQRTSQSPCTAEYICANGKRTPKLEWNTNCKGTNTAAVTAKEETGNQDVALFGATSNEGKSLSYTLESVLPTRCVPGNVGSWFTLSSSGQLTIENSIDLEECPTFDITIKVATSGQSSVSLTCDVSLTMLDTNDSPTIEQNPVREVYEKSKVNTAVGDPIFASDPDAGQELSFTLGGPDSALFKIGACSGLITVLDPTIAFSQTPANNVKTVTVTVTDDSPPDNGTPTALSATTTVTINILNINDPPVFSSVVPTFEVYENAVAGQGLVGPDLGPVVTDEDGDPLTYSITRNDGNAFQVVPSTGVIQVKNANTINYENRDSYNIEITVTDQQLSASKDFTITVVNRNDQPKFVAQSYTFSVDEDASANTDVGTVTATDEDAATSITYSVSPDTVFRVIPTTGVIQLIAANLNFEATPSYTLTVTATDNGITGDTDPKTATVQVTVQVSNVNEQPSILPQTVHVDEGSPIGTAISPAITATDPDNINLQTQLLFFSLNSTARVNIGTLDGILTVTSELDFEVKPASFAVLVTVTDNGAPVALSDAAVITVIIDPVNEPPTFNSGVVRSVAELQPAGTLVGASLMSEADDPDAGTTLTFTMESDNAGAFDVSTGGQITTTRELDYERASVFTITVRVSDGELFVLGNVQIQVTNVNEPPYMPPSVFSVPEGEPAGTTVGQLEATDVDHGDKESLVYSLVSASPQFTVTPQGAIKLIAVAPAFGTDPFNLTVKATDPAGAEGLGWSEIKITNVNHRPTVPDHEVKVWENGDPYQVILWDLGASDIDPEDKLQYAIIGGTPENDLGAFFVYPNNGTIRLNGLALDYESTNFFQLLVEVSDDFAGGSLKAYATVNVTLGDEPESPYVAETRYSVLEDATPGTVLGTVVASDEDVGDSLTYTIGAKDGTPATELPFQIGGSTAGGATGVVQVIGALDFEVQPVWDLWVQVTDTVGLTDRKDLTINVLNVNEPPSVESASWSVSEVEAAGYVVGTVVASDTDAGTVLTYAIIAGNTNTAFSVSTNGEVSLARRLDFENIAKYNLTIQVTDDGTGLLQAQNWFEITVIDTNDLAFDSFGGQTTMNTAGGQNIDIFGSNFGPTAYAVSNGATAASVSATYTSATGQGETYNAACAVTVANTKIQCTTAPGIGKDMKWTISVTYAGNTWQLPITAVFTHYHAPEITLVTGADALATSGGETFMIGGRNFGPTDTDVVVEYVSPSDPTVTYTARDCSVTTANTNVTCTSAVGVGSALAFSITLGQQSSLGFSGQGLYKYQNPTITDVAAPTLVTAGGQPVVLTGAAFGAGVAVTASYGPSGVEYTAKSCAISVAHTEIKCLSAPGVGKGHVWMVTVGGLTSQPSADTTSYHVPAITSVDGQGAQLADTAGGELVIVTGTNFGPAGGLAKLGAVPVVKYGGDKGTKYVARQCNVSLEVPHTTIHCFTAPGTGKDHAWTVDIKSQMSAVFAANTSYHPPIVASFPRGYPGADKAVTEGGQPVVIQGDYFGSLSLGTVPTVTYGPEGNEFNASGCAILTSHTEILCNTTEGAGTDLKWVVRVDGQDSKSPTTNYGRPKVLSIVGQPAAGFSSDGGDLFTVTGKNFGPPDGGFLNFVKYGPSGIEYTASQCSVLSHFEIQCTTVPGIGPENVFTVSVASQISDVSSASMAYADPVITNISPDNAVTNGGTLITLTGTNFGLNDVFTKSNIKVEFEGEEIATEFPVTTSKSNHKLEFPVPMGYGVQKAVRIVMHGPNVDVYSNVVRFNYSKPVIDSFTPTPTNQNIDGLPEFVVAVNGSSFCASDECGDLFLGDTKLTTTNWTHDVVFFRSTLANDDLMIRVGFGPPRDSNTVYYENVIPQISALSSDAINRNLYNTAGHQILHFGGTQFSLTGMNVTVRGKPCNFLPGYPREVATPPDEMQEYELLCYTPQGQGTINPVIVHLGNSAGPPMNLRYKPPTITSAVLERTGQLISTIGADGTTVTIHMPTIGGHVMLYGEQFGQAGFEELNLFYRDSVPPISAPRNHSAMNVTLPPGDGTRYALELTVEDQPTTNKVYVSFNAPQIRSVNPLNGPTAGGIPITITGIDFGDTLPTVMIGTQQCDIVSSGHFVIVCTLPFNQGTGHAVTVTVNGQTSNQVQQFLFNYDRPVLQWLTPLSGNTNGGQVMTLVGTNLGRRDAIIRFSAGTDGSAATEATSGNVTLQTDTMIKFLLPEGQGIGHRVSVDVSGLTSVQTSSNLTFTYNPPTIAAISPLEAPTKGGTLLTITGADFGVSDISVTLGGRDCTNVKQDHNKVTCRIPQGLGGNNAVLVTVLTRTSNAVMFNYSKPFVYTVVPNIPNANGFELEVVGVNFGWEQTYTAVTIGEKPCLNAKWRNDGSLECLMQQDVAGQKNVTITVAGQTVQLVGPFVPQCIVGEYGQVGELCLPCPQGGVCEGSFDEPYAGVGWWMVNVATTSDSTAASSTRRLLRSTRRRHLAELSTECPPERANRDFCPVMIPCEPAESCLGNNTCAVGYTGERCSECTVGTHYRLAGECVECPDNPELIVAGFLAAALLMCVGGYALNRKKVNLAFLSIGVDYFQVLAIFATSKVDWPPALQKLFQAMSAFNLNLEIAAPECSIPDVQYTTKWFSIQLLPLAACLLFLLLHAIKYVHKRWIKHVRKARRNSHLSTMIGSLLVMFYYLYLYLTRTTLDVFNCGPTDPPDGKEYMEAVFEECYVPGLTQMTLLPYACVTLVVYTLGFPALVYYILRKNKDNIKTDQILRVLGEGDKRSSPTYQFRKRYHKMYYHFRPGKWYWILVIIGRKALLAVTALMFRSTAAFQLAMALLVMFVAYALQVRHTPYMNLHDKKAIMKAFRDKVEGANARPLYAKIEATIRTLMEDERRKHRKARSWLQNRPTRQEVQQFFWDYNTVEAVLLFCAVLVNLAGIMFESGRFESSYYEGQRDLITYIVMIVVVFSIVYFCVVFCAEAFGVCTPGCKKKKVVKKPRGARKDDGLTRRKSIAVFQNNPMLTGANVEADEEALKEFLASDVLPPPGVWTAVRSKYMELANTVAEQSESIRALKKQNAGRGSVARDESSQRSSRRRAGGTRTEFSARPTRQRSDKRSGRRRPQEVELSDVSAHN